MTAALPEVLLPPLPRHDDAESSVLGGILVHPSLLFDVAATLRPEHFHQHFNRAIYGAMLTLAKQAEPIDVLTVHHALKDPEIPMSLIDRLTTGVPRGVNVAYYAGMIRNAARLRDAIRHAADVITAAVHPGAEATQVIEHAQAAYFGLSHDDTSAEIWWADAMTAELAREVQGTSDEAAVPPVLVGLPSVDALFEGFGGGDLAVLAGRPSTGKTALASQIALTASEDRVVLTCALEMRHTAMWRRALASISRVQIPTHKRRTFTGHEEHLIGRGLAHLSGLKMAIVDMPRGTDMRVLSTARRIQMQHGLGLIVIDYLQLMSAEGRFRTRSEELEELTRSLKQIAMQLNVPVLVLAALSRDATNERPRMEHIRQCGTAEYDADHIFLLHRDVQKQKDLPEGLPSESELIIEKQRNGPTGFVPLLYMGETYRFVSKAVA